MTGPDQDKLFRRICARYFVFSKTWASGYLHGLLDEDLLMTPKAAILARAEADDDYASGYCWGFADARGEDVLEQRWTARLGIVGTSLNYCWWRD